MYDIRQFKPALNLVVLLGITGFGLAAESPGLWLFAASLIGTQIWLASQGAFRPIPRIVANVITVLALLFAFAQIHTHGADSPIVAIGQYLVLLQIVKTWEQRANRDFAQLLVLSLLLMVAAAISTASLAFGALFVVYLLTSLYCCLLFHLKVETDDAKAAEASAAGAVTAIDDRLRAERDRGLAASMRRLTGLIAGYALLAAIAVFLFFPRGAGAGMFGQYMWKPNKALTGFSEQVGFQNVAQITQNNDQVGTVRITRDGHPQQFAGALLLRGYTDDYYSGDDNTNGGKWQWSHGPRPSRDPAPDDRYRAMTERDGGYVGPPDVEAGGGDPTAAGDRSRALRQEVVLNPTGTHALFALPGISRARIDDNNRSKVQLEYCGFDGTMRANERLEVPIRYTVEGTGDLGDEAPASTAITSVIAPAIRAFALRADLTGGLGRQRTQEAYAVQHPGVGYASPLDEEIAGRIERYLQHNYSYTLDLTKENLANRRDPMVGFLTDFKKGHCEYFAGAMTLLCQSLGMQARLVVGFKADDFNTYGKYYTIRQSQAHTWVEVRTTRGWRSYDPTGGREVAAAAPSLWQRVRGLFDFMEYTWQRSVISYNSDNRQNLIESVNARLTSSTLRGATSVYRFRDRLEAVSDWLASHIVGPLILLVAAVLLGVFGWFTFDRYRLRRRAERIGLGDLPPDAQARLVRQLAFYDGLVKLLARHRIARPAHLTPLEFSRSLSFLPPPAYDTIRRLTAIFYRIRYGGADLDDGRQRRLLDMVQRLEGMLPAPNAE